MPTTRTSTEWVGLARQIGVDLRRSVQENDRTGEISTEAFERFRETGITAALVPVEYGGGGATQADMVAIIREIGRHDPSTALTLSMHSHVVATQVWRNKHGLDATAVFGKVVDDRAVFFSTGASDWVDSNGTARKVDGGFVVSARKSPASGCEVADVAATSFVWDDNGAPKVIHCTVPCGADGVSIDKTWDTLGMRATGSHTIVFDDVLVPDAAVPTIRPVGEWPALLNTVVGAALPLIMATYVGVADAAVAEVQTFAAGRDVPHVIQIVGEMLSAHTVANDAVAAMVAEADNLEFTATDDLASRMLIRKRTAGDAVIDCVRLAIEATGGMGFMRTSSLERLYRDAHGSMFHPLPRAKQLRFTGRTGLGLAPYG